ncbi:MAG TPA: transporter [Acidobacteria bacterium]|jgi:osmotically-inducible protein OsmY|nr:transporter [Acidobacteriota bacterium]HAK56546.1 transporter [Acidobacteriota bacterium]|tara:strand:+ start:7907 stop:8221 length:315 start_codon:yes stop_codon:yes gene_type:complete
MIAVAAGACGPTLVATYDDASITARVTRAILSDPLLDGLSITVDTLAGTVTLTGEVRAEQQAIHAGAVARTVDGVVDVELRLRIAPAERPDVLSASRRRGATPQ